ncbi:MAG: EamA/RhaT family transporter [Xanthomonadaceae bacterium]|nr:EamA/RhaT family transporter [Xanthomonadaceae bacterium]
MQNPSESVPAVLSTTSGPESHSTVAVHPLRAVLLVMAAVFLFACMDTSTKVLTGSYPPPIVIAVRYSVQCLLMLAILAPSQGRRLVQTRRTGMVVLRSACLALASVIMAIAFHRLPVAEATAIVFLSPLLVVLISGTVLKERVGGFGIVAAIAGFAGVLLIARPGAGLDPLGVACALAGAVLIASYQLMSRLLARTENTIPMLFYTAMIGSLIYGLMFPWFWEGRLPDARQAVLFICTGVAGGLGHFLFTAAHRHAPASVLAPVMYVQLVWAGLLGWLVFGHVADPLSIVGMLVVAAAGAAVALRAHLPKAALLPE